MTKWLTDAELWPTNELPGYKTHDPITIARIHMEGPRRFVRVKIWIPPCDRYVYFYERYPEMAEKPSKDVLASPEWDAHERYSAAWRARCTVAIRDYSEQYFRYEWMTKQ